MIETEIIFLRILYTLCMKIGRLKVLIKSQSQSQESAGKERYQLFNIH